MADMFGVLSPVLLMAMIAGVVEFAKTVAKEGFQWPMFLSAFLGLFFGLIYQLSIAIPGSALEWLAISVYSLLFGLAVSGFYDLAKRAGNALAK